MMKMDVLKAVFEGLGFENVKSYINSGNFAFDTKKTAENKLVDKIEDAVEAKFDRRVHVMIREQGDIERVISTNPFHGAFGSHKEMHVLFLKEPLSAEKEKLLRETAFDGERYTAMGREIYAHLPKGVAESSLSKKAILDKAPCVSYTGRNWRTVEKLAEL
jgi:uncharacterized protein (DUF1697 family)